MGTRANLLASFLSFLWECILDIKLPTCSNPSFYDEEFNLLDKYIVSEEKRDEITFNFKSAIVNDKMFKDVYEGSSYDLLKYHNDTNYWGTANREQATAKDLKPVFSLLEYNISPLYVPFSRNSYSEPYDYDIDEGEQFDVGFYNSFTSVGNEMHLKATNLHNTGFKFVSFVDSEMIIGDDNLYKQSWYRNIMDSMYDESVIISLDIYTSEATIKQLMNFPAIWYKGSEWVFKGFNDFPLSSQDGGITNITIIKKNVWN